MSSILDALRKLEEEKAVAAQAVEVMVDDATAAQDLVGDTAWGNDRAFHVTRAGLILGAGLLVGVVVLASIGTTLIVTRSAPGPKTAPMQIASPPAPIPATPSTTAVAIAPAAPTSEVGAQAPALGQTPRDQGPAVPVDGRVASVLPAPLPTAPTAPPREVTAPPLSPSVTAQAVAASISVNPIQVSSAASAPTPTPSAIPVVAQSAGSTPAAPLATPSLNPTTPPQAVTYQPQQSTPKRPPLPKNLRQLPTLSDAVKARYRIEGKRLRMPRPKTYSAMIDKSVVNVGEVILGTNARLVGVDSRGVALEIIGTGERYYWPM